MIEENKVGRGGARKGAGRPKGSKNKRTLAREALGLEVLKGGTTAYEYLYNLFRKYVKNGNEKEAREIAQELVPYEKPRLAAVDSKIEGSLQYEAQKIPVHERDSDAIGATKGTA